MVICRQILQIGVIAVLATGCAAPRGGPEAIAVRPPQAGPAVSDDLTVSAHETDAASLAPSALLTSSGQIRAAVRLYAQQLAAERNLPLKAVLNLLTSARYNDTAARFVATPASEKSGRNWLHYQARFVEPKRIAWGRTFWEENRSVLERAAQQYGVPAAIIVSIIGVETLYGRRMGSFKVLDTLTTLAFDYPEPVKPERVAMFRAQLSDFIVLCLSGKIDPNVYGSPAGAIGMPQFMPGSLMRYAVDGNNDGRINLINSAPDTIMSIGNFLQQHGWQHGIPVFAPVRLLSDPSRLVDGGLKPATDWAGLQRAGARLLPSASGGLWQLKPLGVIDLPEEPSGKTQYRVATENFFALTAYNRSYFYAAAVADLASAIENARNPITPAPGKQRGAIAGLKPGISK